VFPGEDVVLLPVPLCSAEEMAKYLLERCAKEIPFPKNITRVELGVDEGRGQGGWAVKTL
ncbi:MAG: 6-pyruvoyl tetrahydropterin synthase family protein, partial [Candidatus Thermoplasmatota archaeon]|nr:6-pyruvoyl tetrahydropterin synthase family protein [Candidatus Thermoplasmatota archaeon]